VAPFVCKFNVLCNKPVDLQLELHVKLTMHSCATVLLQGLHPALLKYLPGTAVMPGDAYSYVFAELISAATWAAYLQEDPLDPVAGLALRQRLFEAKTQAGTAAAVEQLLGKGSMVELAVPVRLGSSSSSSGSSSSGEEAVGLVPNLEHPAFQDIDLWA
jgi:hypothetical protein